MKFHFAMTIDEVLGAALEPAAVTAGGVDAKSDNAAGPRRAAGPSSLTRAGTPG